MGFKVGDKVEVVSEGWENSKGTVLTVKRGPEGPVDGGNYYFEETREIILGKDLTLHKLTKNQRITALEKEVAELKIIVEDLRERKAIKIGEPKLEGLRPSAVIFDELIEQPNEIIEFEGAKYRKVEREAREGDVAIVRWMNGKNPGAVKLNKPYKVFSSGRHVTLESESFATVYSNHYGRTSETVEIYELIEQPKSPNQQRAEIIEKAKKFVEGYTPIAKCGTTPITSQAGDIRIEFVVDAKKRTIVALPHLAHTGGISRPKGIAKCHPNNVFNEHIGKAIALGRALGLDVSEFEQAVQPSHYAIGQIGINSLGTSRPFEVIRIGKGEVFKKNFEPYTNSYGNTTRPLNFEDEDYKALKIINDTNAQYGEVE